MSPRGFETLSKGQLNLDKPYQVSTHLASRFLFMLTLVTVERRRPPAALAKLPFSAMMVVYL